MQEHHCNRLRHGSVLERLSAQARPEIREAIDDGYTVCMPVLRMRKRKTRRRRHTQMEQAARFHLTRLSGSPYIETCITIGVRVLLTIIVLSVLAYVCLIAAVCVTLKRGTQQLEQDYPLTDPPNGNDRPHS